MNEAKKKFKYVDRAAGSNPYSAAYFQHGPRDGAGRPIHPTNLGLHGYKLPPKKRKKSPNESTMNEAPAHEITAYKGKGQYKHADMSSHAGKPDHHSTHSGREEAHAKAEELSKTHAHVYHDWYGVRQSSWHNGKRMTGGVHGRGGHRRASESLLVEIAEFLGEEYRPISHNSFHAKMKKAAKKFGAVSHQSTRSTGVGDFSRHTFKTAKHALKFVNHVYQNSNHEVLHQHGTKHVSVQQEY